RLFRLQRRRRRYRGHEESALLLAKAEDPVSSTSRRPWYCTPCLCNGSDRGRHSMKRTVENWSVERLHKARTQISFPEYQRQPKLWSVEKKQLLIDSILRDIDIPKL